MKINKLPSRKTALRDIDFLIERGVLRRVDAARSTHYEIVPPK